MKDQAWHLLPGAVPHRKTPLRIEPSSKTTMLPSRGGGLRAETLAMTSTSEDSILNILEEFKAQRRDRMRGGREMVSLNSLPDEIVHEILQFLPQSALYQATLVNRKINRLSVPLLYESFDQQGNDARSLYQFLKVTKRVTQFSSATHRINIRGSPRISCLQARRNFAKRPQLAWARHLYENHEEYGYKHLEHGPDMAVLMLLSSNLNINSIRVGFPSNSVGQNAHSLLPIYLAPLQESFQTKFPCPPIFDNLSSLDFSMFYVTWPVIAPLFRLPSLKRLVIIGAADEDGYESTKEIRVQYQSSSIETLHFESCEVSLLTVIAALSSCRALRDFRHSLKTSDSVDLHKSLYARLYEHRSTLHTLSIVGQKELDHHSQMDISFAEFPVLRSLTMDYSAIVAKNLPLSIEWLFISVDGHDDSHAFNSIFQFLDALVDAKISKKPKIGLMYHCRKRPGTYLNFRKVIDTFRFCGYELQIYARPASARLWGYAATINEMEAVMHSMRQEMVSSEVLINHAHGLGFTRSLLAYEYYTKRTWEIQKVQELVNGCKNWWQPEDDDFKEVLPFLRGE